MNDVFYAVQARHDGRCGLCDEQIEQGAMIVNYAGEWCHEHCAEDEGGEVR